MPLGKIKSPAKKILERNIELEDKEKFLFI